MKIDEKLVEKAIKEGYEIVNKIQSARTISEINALYDEIEKYSDFANENFGIIDEFAGDENSKYSDLGFYLDMAAEEKELHLDYYALHPDEMCSGVSDFIYYLESKTWLQD